MKRPITESERRKLSIERKQRAAQRMGFFDDEAPGLTIRISPGVLYPSSGEHGPLVPLLVPDIELKSTAGRYQPRKIVVRLRQSLAVHTLMAFHGLLPLLDTPQAVKDKLDTAAGSGVDRLLREGRRHLSRETAFGSENALQRLSEKRQELFKSAGIEIPWRRGELIAAELSAVRLVSIALVRAQAILAAFEDAQRAAKTLGKNEATVDDDSWTLIRDTFGRYHHDLGIGALWEIAIYADINPSVLWPQHTMGFAELFEIARFIGRIDRGIEAGLDPAHLDQLSAILTIEPQGSPSDGPTMLAGKSRTKLLQHFSKEALLDILDAAKRRATGIRVARETRVLGLVERPMPNGQAKNASGQPA